MMLLAEVEQQIEAKNKELLDIFEKGKMLENGKPALDAQGRPTYSLTAEQLLEVNKRNDELTELGKSRDQLRMADAAFLRARQDVIDRNTPANNGVPAPGQSDMPGQQAHTQWKSLGERFVEHATYDSQVKKSAWFTGKSMMVSLDDVGIVELGRGEGKGFDGGAEFKDVFTTTTGFAPFVPRIPRIILSAQRRPVVADLIPQDTTQASAIKYMVETLFTRPAGSGATPEGAAKPEVALGFGEVTSPMEKVAAILPVTDEQLADVPQIRGIIDNRLTLMIQLGEEDELVNGSGVSPHIAGLLNRTGIQAQAVGTDPVPDAVFKAMTKIRFNAFADPTGVIVNPFDWQNIRLLRTADGLYIWGSPSEAGPERLWGNPIVPTPAMPQGSIIVADFQMYTHISRRQGITIDVSNSHLDYFAKNMQAIRIEERLSLEVYRPAAVCQVTGLPA